MPILDLYTNKEIAINLRVTVHTVTTSSSLYSLIYIVIDRRLKFVGIKVQQPGLFGDIVFIVYQSLFLSFTVFFSAKCSTIQTSRATKKPQSRELIARDNLDTSGDQQVPFVAGDKAKRDMRKMP